MNPNIQSQLFGEMLGNDGYKQLIEHACAVCEHERQRIELSNQSRIAALQDEGVALQERETDLTKRIYIAKPPHEERTRVRRIYYCRTVAVVLIVASFILSLLTFEPFRLGYKALVYCLGIAIATPFLIEKALDALASEKLVRVLVSVAGVCALLSLMTIALIRGELMSMQTQEDSPAVTIDDGQSQPTPLSSSNTFYQDTVPLLEAVMVLLAFSMETGAGIALHEAERVQSNLGERHSDLVGERNAVRVEIRQKGKELIELQNEAKKFVEQFWRDFHWAVLKRTVAGATKAFAAGALILLLLFAPQSAQAQQKTELVVLIDLSQSVGAQGQDGRSEFQKNVTAVSEVLGQTPLGSHVSVLGITDNSFAQPYALLSATIISDPGYFGEHLAAAHQQLQIAWAKRARDLSPSYPGTDLLGAVMVAAQIFEKAGASRHVLVVLSDMHQETGELASSSANVCAQQTMESIKSRRLLANLQNSDVYAVGVDSAGTTKADWMCVHDFWSQYFVQAGAALREYSVLRSLSLRGQ